MISQIEFVRMVDVQSETVERYIKDGKVKPDLSIPFGDKRMFHYFREESIRNIAKQYGWDLITPQNMADKFMKFIETMDMSYSYKPVLLKAIYEYMDSSGRVALPDVVDYFIDFYEDRKAHGMIAEKSTSIYQKGGYTRKDVEKNVLSNPFKRFEDKSIIDKHQDLIWNHHETQPTWEILYQGAHEIIGFKDLLHNAHRLFGFSEIKDNEDTFNNLTRLAQDAGVPIGTFWEQEGKDDVWLRNHIIEIKSPILIERNNTSIYSDKKVKSQQILCIGCTEKKLKEILQK